MAGTIQQHDVQIALQLLDHIAQSGGGFIQRLRGGGEGSVAVKSIKDHQNIKVYAHMKLSINLFSLLYLSAIIKASE